MYDFAKVSFNGIFSCNVPVEKLSLINEKNFKVFYSQALNEMVQDAVVVAFNELLVRAARGIKPGGKEIQLIEALKQAIQYDNQIYEDGRIGVLSLDKLDKLLEIKKGKWAGTGWWRVLESKESEIVVEGYRFVKEKGEGKFGEGRLYQTHKSNLYHRYSIRDKRYVTKFVNKLTRETLNNEIFMDRVMLKAVSKMMHAILVNNGEFEDE